MTLSNDLRHRRWAAPRVPNDVRVELRIGDRPPMLVRVELSGPPRPGARFSYGGATWELTGLERGVFQAMPVFVTATTG